MPHIRKRGRRNAHLHVVRGRICGGFSLDPISVEENKNHHADHLINRFCQYNVPRGGYMIGNLEIHLRQSTPQKPSLRGERLLELELQIDVHPVAQPLHTVIQQSGPDLPKTESENSHELADEFIL